MKKLIVSLVFTITLPLFQVAVAQETEITKTFSDTDINELEQNICNNLEEVNYILSKNQPYETVLTDGTLVVNSSGTYKESNDDDDDDDDGGSTIVPAAKVDRSIMADPLDPSSQQAVTDMCI